MSKVKLGVIGVGNMGTGHLSNYIKGSLPEIEVTAVAAGPTAASGPRTTCPSL